jgi:hypothetical protein
MEKRKKIFLNGYEMWIDISKLVSSRHIMLFDKEDSKNGIGFDVLGSGYVNDNHLTKGEQKQLSDYIKSLNLI